MWALLSCLLAALTWSALGATVFQLLPPYGPATAAWDFVVAVPWAFLGTAYFALFIAALAFPVYSILFTVWLVVLQRRPSFGATRGRRNAAALAFAFPPALLLAHGFGRSDGFPFEWAEAARIFPCALFSAWCGIAISARPTEHLLARMRNLRYNDALQPTGDRR